MSATTITPTRLNIVFESAASGLQSSIVESVTPLLEVALAQTGLHGAYVYGWDTEQSRLQLVAWSGLKPTVIARFDVQIGGIKTGWHLDMTTPTTLNQGAWSDWRFEDFPEFLHHRFEAATSIPLFEAGRFVGVANFARRERGPQAPETLEYLRRLSVPLGTLLAGALDRDRLRAGIVNLTQQLADRKHVERAKGILQSRFALSEAEAYLRLRLESRRRRTPMREVARQVIDADLQETTRAHATA